MFFIIYVLLKRNRPTEAAQPAKLHKFGVIVCARNEESVISGLIDSILKQSYPQELINLYVVADNCSDLTAEVAQKNGSTVFIRNNPKLIGKGYALDFAFKKLFSINDDSDAYLVFDADNLVDKDFIKEMNLCLNKGYKVLTSYRNSKNYGTNWITSGYSLWFMREAKYLNKARQDLKLSCAISGTGFCIKREVIEAQGGWKHHLLTEDIEFTIDSVIHGEKFGISEKSVLYDEQPITFKSSWNQRLRWTKGFYQILSKYGAQLVKGIFKGSFSCYDFLMTVFPASAYTIYCFVKSIVESIYGLIAYTNNHNIYTLINTCIFPIISCIGSMYLLFFAMGIITMITEHKVIRATNRQKIRSLFTFPLFMMTYCPIAVVALFKKVIWTPIPHTIESNIDDFDTKHIEVKNEK